MPEALVKSVSFKDEQVHIHLKDGRVVRPPPTPGEDPPDERTMQRRVLKELTVWSRPPAGDHGPPGGGGGSGAQRGPGQVGRSGGGRRLRGVPGQRGAAGALQHLGGRSSARVGVGGGF